MQPVTREGLRGLIEEAKAAGKDTAELEQLHSQEMSTPVMGEVRQIGDHLIVSTGPAREEDFE